MTWMTRRPEPDPPPPVVEYIQRMPRLGRGLQWSLLVAEMDEERAGESGGNAPEPLDTRPRRSIFAAIDAAIGCQKCGGPLGKSPSSDFCGAACQAAWHAAYVEPLTNYREAGHDFMVDAVRFNGPEPEYAWGSGSFIRGNSIAASWFDEAYHWPLADIICPDGTTERIYTDTAMGLRDWGTLSFGGRTITVTYDRPFGQQPDPPSLEETMARALEARRNRNTGPVSRARAPRTINARGRR